MKYLKQQIAKQAAQIRTAFAGVISRAGQQYQVKGLVDELLDDLPLYQQVGLVSGLPIDAEVILLPLSGKSQKSVIIASRGGRVVMNVSTGETCVYDQFGHSILLHKNGIKIVGDIELEGSLKATGDVSDKVGSMQTMREQYNEHNHIPTLPPPNVLMD